MSSNLQKFGAYDLDAADDEQAALDAEGGEFMKLGVGRNVVRILPPLRGQKSPFRVAYQHYVETADGKWVFTCPRMEARKHCPLCNYANKLRASGKPADRDRAYDLLPKRRVFCSVINRAEPEKGPVVLAFGKTIHEALVALRRDEAAGGDFSHPIDGIDVIIDRKGTGKNDTKYSVNLARRTSPIHEDGAQVAEWADMMPDLNAFARLSSDEEIQEKMEKYFGPETIEAEADEPPPRQQQQRRRGTPPRRTAQQDVSDAEYEDEAGGDGNADWGMPEDAE